MHSQMKPTFVASIIFAAALSITAGSTTASESGRWHVNQKNQVLDGYDVVAYQSADKAVRGQPQYATTFEGARFLFVSAENRETFRNDPGKYAPSYGGFCAFAMGKAGQKVPANPETFKMYNGKLLVFFNDLHQGKQFNTKVPWNGSEQTLHANAEQNWLKAP